MPSKSKREYNDKLIERVQKQRTFQPKCKAQTFQHKNQKRKNTRNAQRQDWMKDF